MPFGGGLLTLQECAEETTTAATETININTGRRHVHEHGQQAAAEDDNAVCIIVLVLLYISASRPRGLTHSGKVRAVTVAAPVHIIIVHSARS